MAKLRVGLLFGGRSTEHEVSIASASSILRSLDPARYDVRLVDGGEEFTSSPWETNIRPDQMSQQQLFDGLHWVCNRMYRPEAFGQRLIQMIERMGPQRGPFQTGMPRRKPRAPIRPSVSRLSIPGSHRYRAATRRHLPRRFRQSSTPRTWPMT